MCHRWVRESEHCFQSELKLIKFGCPFMHHTFRAWKNNGRPFVGSLRISLFFYFLSLTIYCLRLFVLLGGRLKMRPIRLAKRFQIHKNFRALLQMNEIRAESFWQESWSHFYVITSIRSKPNTTIQQQQQQREKNFFFGACSHSSSISLHYSTATNTPHWMWKYTQQYYIRALNECISSQRSLYNAYM